ncbi:hypothetical protein MMC20_001193 [Loxospora ochrophaea]|nr:hypothetical protein [Loxospora ochrophaea]
MASKPHIAHSLHCIRSNSPFSHGHIQYTRYLSTVPSTYSSRLPPRTLPPGSSPVKKIKTYPPPPSTRRLFPEPVSSFTNSQLSILDPTGSRTRLFSRSNPDAAKVGDILLTRFQMGEPFAGICMNIRRRGVDTGILLRSQLTRVGTELWVKVYSPRVTGVEVVQRREKRARRARLYYLRKPKHDRGNLSGIVDAYLRERRLLRSGRAQAVGSAKGRDANAQKKTARKN